MAEGKAGGAGKKPALSNRILQMKFMQRSKDKAAVQEAAKEQVCVMTASVHIGPDGQKLLQTGPL